MEGANLRSAEDVLYTSKFSGMIVLPCYLGFPDSPILPSLREGTWNISLCDWLSYKTGWAVPPLISSVPVCYPKFSLLLSPSVISVAADFLTLCIS